MRPADRQTAATVLALARRALQVAERACHRAETQHAPRALAAARAAAALAANWHNHAQAALDAAAHAHHLEVRT
jgi:hypothetical protein